MKKGLTILLTLVIALSLCACGNSTKTPVSKDSGEQKDSQEKSAEQGDDNTKTGPISIDEVVLFDQDGVIVTAKEWVEDSIWGPGIKVLVENNSDNNVRVQCDSIVVNNYMISSMFTSPVATGKKSNDNIYFSSSELKAANITAISHISIIFKVLDDDNYSTLFSTAEIEIQTSAYGTIEQPAMDDGKELYNQDGIRIVGRYVEEDSFWGAGVQLFIENNYGENILVQCDNMSVNGFMITPLYSSTINDGKMAVNNITIMSSDLEANDIETVEDIELIFKILNSDTYHKIVETEPIAFTTK